MFRSDYWTLVITSALSLLFLYLGFGNFEDLRSILLVILMAYLVALLAYPYFKQYFFRQAVIFDFVGVFAAGTEDDWYLGVIRERKGMRQLILRLKRNYKVALFTNNNWEAHRPFSRKFGLSSLFDFEFSSSLIGKKKPSAESYLAICRLINVSPQKAVMVDDRAENLVGAKQAGLRTVLFQSLEQCEHELKALGLKF